MDIGDLTGRADEDLVKGLWDAMDAEDVARKVKEAIRDELRRRLGPTFAGGVLRGHGRGLRTYWSRTCRAIDRDMLAERIQQMGLESEVYSLNTARLAKLIESTDAEEEFGDCVVIEPTLIFQRVPGDA